MPAPSDTREARKEEAERRRQLEGNTNFKDLGEPIQKLLMQVSKNVSAEDISLLTKITVRQLAKVFDMLALEEDPDKILAWLKREARIKSGLPPEEETKKRRTVTTGQQGGDPIAFYKALEQKNIEYMESLKQSAKEREQKRSENIAERRKRREQAVADAEAAKQKALETGEVVNNKDALRQEDLSAIVNAFNNKADNSNADNSASNTDTEWWKQDKYRRDFEKGGRKATTWSRVIEGGSQQATEAELSTREEWFRSQCWWKSDKYKRDWQASRESEWWKEETYIKDWQDNGDKAKMWLAADEDSGFNRKGDRRRAAGAELQRRIQWYKNNGPKGIVKQWCALGEGSSERCTLEEKRERDDYFKNGDWWKSEKNKIAFSENPDASAVTFAGAAGEDREWWKDEKYRRDFASGGSKWKGLSEKVVATGDTVDCSAAEAAKREEWFATNWWKADKYREDFDKNGENGKLWKARTEGDTVDPKGKQCRESEARLRADWFRSAGDREWWKDERFLRDYQENGKAGKQWTAAYKEAGDNGTGDVNRAPEDALLQRSKYFDENWWKAEKYVKDFQLHGKSGHMWKTGIADAASDQDWWKQEEYMRKFVASRKASTEEFWKSPQAFEDFASNGTKGKLWTAANAVVASVAKGDEKPADADELGARQKFYTENWWRSPEAIRDFATHGSDGKVWTAAEQGGTARAAPEELRRRREFYNPKPGSVLAFKAMFEADANAPVVGEMAPAAERWSRRAKMDTDWWKNDDVKNDFKLHGTAGAIFRAATPEVASMGLGGDPQYQASEAELAKRKAYFDAGKNDAAWWQGRDFQLEKAAGDDAQFWKNPAYIEDFLENAADGKKWTAANAAAGSVGKGDTVRATPDELRDRETYYKANFWKAPAYQRDFEDKEDEGTLWQQSKPNGKGAIVPEAERKARAAFYRPTAGWLLAKKPAPTEQPSAQCTAAEGLDREQWYQDNWWKSADIKEDYAKNGKASKLLAAASREAADLGLADDPMYRAAPEEITKRMEYFDTQGDTEWWKDPAIIQDFVQHGKDGAKWSSRTLREAQMSMGKENPATAEELDKRNKWYEKNFWKTPAAMEDFLKHGKSGVAWKRGLKPPAAGSKFQAPPKPANASEFRNQLINLLTKYQPEKLHKVDEMLAENEGREAQLIASLEQQLGAVPSDEEIKQLKQAAGALGVFSAPPAPADVVDPASRKKLVNLFSRFEPSSLPKVDDLLAQHKGQEPAFVNAEEQRIGAKAPSDTEIAALNKLAGASALSAPPITAAVQDSEIRHALVNLYTKFEPRSLPLVDELLKENKNKESAFLEAESLRLGGIPSDAEVAQIRKIAEELSKHAAPSESSDGLNRRRLEKFVMKYQPENLSQVDSLLASHKGKEADLFNGMQKLGDEPTEREANALLKLATAFVSATSPPASAKDTPERKKLINLYTKFQPEKLIEVDALLQQHKGKEPAFVSAEEQRLGAQAPSDEETARLRDIAAVLAKNNKGAPVVANESANRKRLKKFLTKYNPEKLQDIDAMLESNKGKENEMFEDLKKLGPEPTEAEVAALNKLAASDLTWNSRAAEGSPFRQQLTKLYSKYDPDRVPQADALLEGHKGKEAAFIESEEKRLCGQVPSDTEFAAIRKQAEALARHAVPSESQDSMNRKRVQNFFTKYQPEKLGELDAVLAKNKGKEGNLLEELKKFGAEPSDEEVAALEYLSGKDKFAAPSVPKSVADNEIRKRLVNLYTKYQPEKVASVDDLLKANKGNEAGFLTEEVFRLGKEPSAEEVAALRQAASDLTRYEAPAVPAAVADKEQRKRLVNLFSRFEQSSLPKVDDVLADHKGSEKDFVDSEVARLGGVEPSDGEVAALQKLAGALGTAGAAAAVVEEASPEELKQREKWLTVHRPVDKDQLDERKQWFERQLTDDAKVMRRNWVKKTTQDSKKITRDELADALTSLNDGEKPTEEQIKKIEECVARRRAEMGHLATNDDENDTITQEEFVCAVADTNFWVPMTDEERLRAEEEAIEAMRQEELQRETEEAAVEAMDAEEELEKAGMTHEEAQELAAAEAGNAEEEAFLDEMDAEDAEPKVNEDDADVTDEAAADWNKFLQEKEGADAGVELSEEEEAQLAAEEEQRLAAEAAEAEAADQVWTNEEYGEEEWAEEEEGEGAAVDEDKLEQLEELVEEDEEYQEDYDDEDEQGAEGAAVEEEEEEDEEEPDEMLIEEKGQPHQWKLPLPEVTNPQYLKSYFTVIKYTPSHSFLGGKQKRVWVVDHFTRCFYNLERSGKIKKEHAANKLLQLERNITDPTRLRLMFFDASHSYELQFHSPSERERFYESASAIRPSIRVYAPELTNQDQNVEACTTTIDGVGPNTVTVTCNNAQGKPAARELTGECKVNASKLLTEPLTIWVGTFNLSGHHPPRNAADLGKWMPKDKYDIYAVAVQEGSYRKQESDWFEHVQKFLGKDYLALASMSVWDTLLIVLSRKKHLLKITNVEGSTKATVHKSVCGTKGGIGISLRYLETSMAFVTCHLAARLERNAMRNTNIEEIVDGLQLAIRETDFCNQFNHVFMFGDFNYRVELENKAAQDIIGNKEYGKLLEYDQLTLQRRDEGVLHGFQEPPISFAPTYRMQVGSENYMAEKGNSPSYCARVLTRSMSNTWIKCTGYRAVKDVQVSEHLPVNATFIVRCVRPTMSCFMKQQSPVPQFVFEQLRVEDATGPIMKKPQVLLMTPFTGIGKAVDAIKGQTNSPSWRADTLPRLESVTQAQEYLETCHILFVVREGAEKREDKAHRGTAHVPLFSKVIGMQDTAQEFSAELMAHGKLQGKIVGRMRWEAAGHA